MPVPGAVSWGAFNENEYLSTGKMKGGLEWGDGIPIKIDAEKMARGRERFNINCAVCHAPTGAGNGIVTEYGLVGVANFHTDKFRQMPDGQIFHTIANGKGLMNGYPHITPEDRWAIVAYLRALQLAQNAKLEDVPEDKRGNLNPYE
jgi:mono/diheme cytochrome c family protein